jgi:hypothetical protein
VQPLAPRRGVAGARAPSPPRWAAQPRRYSAAPVAGGWPANPQTRIWSDDQHFPTGAARGRGSPRSEGVWHSPERQRAAQRAQVIRRAAGRGTLLTVEEQRAVSEGSGEADERAARELGEAAYPFETLCAVLWGRSLSAKRDARLAATGADQGSASSGIGEARPSSS